MKFRLLLGALILSSPFAWGVESFGPDATLVGEHFQATVSRQTGRLISLAFRGGANVLRRPVIISVRDEVSRKVKVLTSPLDHFQATPSSCSFAQQLSDLTVESSVVMGQDLSWEIKLRNKATERRDISVWFDFGGLPPDRRAFLTSTYPHPPLRLTTELTYGYRAEGMPLVIPAATFYSRTAHAGLTILSPLTIPVQGFQARVGPSGGSQVGRVDLRLESQGEVRTQVFLSLHAPDWRPGLAYIRDKYPDSFKEHYSPALEINAPFLWSSTAPEEQVRQWHDQGVRWVEVHFTYPFLGKYVPDEPRWVPAMDDQWIWEKVRQASDVPLATGPFEQIRNYMEERLTPWETPDEVKTFIRLLHRYDIKALMYFQPSECFVPYAREQFQADLVHDQNGSVIPAWYEDVVLNPRPGSAWGRYVEDQFKDLLAFYPEADGIFEDQSAYDLLDYAHDDGFSIHGGRTAYRMGYAICLLTSKLEEYAHSHGKIVWWNGPSTIEAGAIGDGFLAEASEDFIQWLAIGNKPLTSGAWYPELYDRMLRDGIQPGSPSLMPVSLPYRYAHRIPAEAKIPPRQLKDFERYRSLFQEIQKREWVLTANAVEVPPGFDANIFRQPNGNYAVPVVTSRAEETTGTALGVPVTVRVPDAAAVRGVYLLNADVAGWFRAPWKRVGRAIVVTLPRQHRASLLVLAKSGFFAALDSEVILVEGRQKSPNLILDNWLKEPATGAVSLGSSVTQLQVPAESSSTLPVSLESMRRTEDQRLVLPIRITFTRGGPQGELSLQPQLLQVPPLETGWEGTLKGYQGVSTSVRMYVINHGDVPLLVRLLAEGEKRVEITALPAAVHLAPHAHQFVTARIRPTEAGEAEFRLVASAPSSVSRREVKFHVWRTCLDPKAEVVSASIRFEGFVPDGMPDLRKNEPDAFQPTDEPESESSASPPHSPGYKPRPVKIDGRLIGYLPSRNQSQWMGMDFRIPRPELQQLGKSVEVSFSPADAQDVYKLRNIQLVFHMTDESDLTTTLDPKEYSTRPSGDTSAKPISVRFNLPEK